MLAASNWHLYQTGASAESTPMVATASGVVENLVSNMLPASEPPVQSAQPAGQPGHSILPSNQFTVLPDQPTVPLNQPPVPLDQFIAPLDQFTIPFNQLTVPLDEPMVLLDDPTVSLDDLTLDEPTVSFDRFTVPLDQFTVPLNIVAPSQSGALLNHEDNMFIQDSLPIELCHTPNYLQATANWLSGDQSDNSHSPATTTTTPVVTDLHAPPLIPDARHPFILSATEPLQVTPSQPCAQVGIGFPEPSPDNRPAAQSEVHSPSEPLAGVADEPSWMRKKRTLNYFRETAKLGCFSSVIERWYKLEGLLGLQETVSIFW